MQNLVAVDPVSVADAASTPMFYRCGRCRAMCAHGGSGTDAMEDLSSSQQGRHAGVLGNI
eukprot:3705343-Prymnesium_polylepis.1